MPAPRPMLVLVLLALLLPLAGCGSGPAPVAAPALPDDPPDDFALAVTVFGPETGPDQVADLPRAVRPARYILEPDGVLRAAVGPGASPDAFPPQTRRLTSRQVAQLWRMVRDQGLLGAGHPGRITSPQTYIPPPDRRAVLVEIAAAGQRRYLELHVDDRAEDPATALALTDRLAELSWLRS